MDPTTFREPSQPTPTTSPRPTATSGSGGNITAVSGYSLDSGSYTNGTGYSNGSITKITITFTTTVSNPVLAWGGHISKRQEWAPEPTAATFSGSPYHMRLKEVDGKGGNQDRSLSSDAVISPATLKINKNANLPGNTSFPFTTSAASGTSASLRRSSR